MSPQTLYDPDEPWLEELKFRSAVARNSAFVRYHSDRGEGDNIRLNRRISLKNFKLNAKFEHLIVQGVKIRVYSKYAVAKLFKVTPITVHNWIHQGVMPKPFITKELSDGRTVVYWTTSQCLCMAKVVEQFYKAGFRIIPWNKYDNALRMMHKAGRIGVKRTMRHVEKQIAHRNKKERKKAHPPYGVVFKD